MFQKCVFHKGQLDWAYYSIFRQIRKFSQKFVKKNTYSTCLLLVLGCIPIMGYAQNSLDFAPCADVSNLTAILRS